MRVAGIDLGGTKVDVLFRNDSGTVVYEQWPTSNFASVTDVIQRVSFLGGTTLDRVAVAVAGRVEPGGAVRLTNVPWPVFEPASIPASMCGHVTVVNDVECAAGAVATLEPSEYHTLLAGADERPDELVAVAVSTGVNSCHRDAAGRVHAAESGHVGWQPWFDGRISGTLPSRLLAFLQRMDPTAALITVEDVLSGDRGFDNLYSFVTAIGGVSPSDDLYSHVASLRCKDGRVGPAITQAAHDEDPCAVMCMTLWGALLGQYLRGRVLSHLPEGGTVWLYGGIAQAPGVMDFVMQNTQFTRHFMGRGARMSGLMGQIALKQVTSSDRFPLTVRGALELAKT